MRLLFVIRTVHRDYGGPLEGTREIANELVRLGHSAEVAHMDPPGSEGESYFDVPIHAFGPSLGDYGYSARLAPWMRAHAGEYDAVIVNGLWHYPGLGIANGLRGSATPYFLFTHGSLHPWFCRASPWKRLQRSVYWKAVESRVMLGARAILFTSHEERELARLSYTPFPADLRVVPYCAAEPPDNLHALAPLFFRRFPALQGRRIVLFLGRIHAVKGCDILVRSFARFCFRDPDLVLVIAGPDPMNLVPGLMQLAQSLGLAGRIFFPGGLYGSEKWAAFAAAGLFVASSHAECFGVSLAAAMAAGLPVAVSRKVNTWREIEEDGAGFAADATVNGILSLLERWHSAGISEIARVGANARRSFQKRYSPRSMAPRLLHALEITRQETSLLK